jgi:hypothetical protein
LIWAKCTQKTQENCVVTDGYLDRLEGREGLG